MLTAIVAPLPDGRFRVESQGWHVVLHDEEEAVEIARGRVRDGGGGVVRLLDGSGATREQITVPAPQPATAGVAQGGGFAALAGTVAGAKSLDDLLEKGADKVVKTGLEGWWEDRNDAEKTATGLIAAALALGPLGQGLLAAAGALFAAGDIPSSKQIEALFWLLWITAPLAAFVVVAVWLPGKLANGPVALIAAGAASVAAAWATLASEAPKALAGVYCYADFRGAGVAYEEQCRAFNNAGFIADNAPRVGSPSASADIFSSAVAYTADARGTAMALAAIMASVGIGLLLREQS
jgi:hypothetical protein